MEKTTVPPIKVNYSNGSNLTPNQQMMFKNLEWGINLDTSTMYLSYEIDQDQLYAVMTRFDNFVTSQSNTVSNTVMDSFKLVSDTVEFKDTFSEFKYYATSKDAEVKDSAIKLTPNKNLDLKQQKQITYTTDTTNTQYQNSFFFV